MAKRRDLLAEQLHELGTLRQQPLPARGTPEYAARQAILRSALTHKSSFAVASAADQLHDSDHDLLALLPDIFTRFLADPVQTDKGCNAKTAIARALERIDSQDDDIFRRGILYVQLEPGFPIKQDTAVELRSICALGLARLGPPGVLSLLAELLADSETAARTAAARALGCSGQPGAVPLLRYKALCGDPEPMVLSECLSAILLLERTFALPFVRRFLDPQNDSHADAAAMALGQSRLPDAVPLLIDYAEEPPRGERKSALYALAMLREPAATDYLLGLVRDADLRLAAVTIDALGMHRYDKSLPGRVAAAAAESRHSPLLREALTKAFP